jgi:ribonuclease HII
VILPDLREEKRLWKRGFRNLVGVDEVGRGALAGPVVAAAVSARSPSHLDWFLKEVRLKLGFELRDSKQLLPHQREEVCKLLGQNPRFTVRFGLAGPKVIDRVNIRRATLLATKRAVLKLPRRSYVLLVDGIDRVPAQLRQFTYIKGDTRIALIALASICAKVKRDGLMVGLARRYPRWQLHAHKGYGTRLHYRKIRQNGRSAIHRKTFLASF